MSRKKKQHDDDADVELNETLPDDVDTDAQEGENEDPEANDDMVKAGLMQGKGNAKVCDNDDPQYQHGLKRYGRLWRCRHAEAIEPVLVEADTEQEAKDCYCEHCDCCADEAKENGDEDAPKKLTAKQKKSVTAFKLPA